MLAILSLPEKIIHVLQIAFTLPTASLIRAWLISCLDYQTNGCKNQRAMKHTDVSNLTALIWYWYRLDYFRSLVALALG